ncbi:hypothetical protein DL89DRAFT_138959 [Linderina pennispora]|uniref:Uncharacterized protein n=1 Tax=Linderina pennispora TaxID=61395 RepID=A0A1Y1WBA4_9FUNG|nr:uncharacterized protein DL89DRAFT_138959 [Linderina pennispora]ORX70722.1 hypothetical protein DL89DRAFT_138959 [Linderina pennispora]
MSRPSNSLAVSSPCSASLSTHAAAIDPTVNTQTLRLGTVPWNAKNTSTDSTPNPTKCCALSGTPSEIARVNPRTARNTSHIISAISTGTRRPFVKGTRRMLSYLCEISTRLLLVLFEVVSSRFTEQHVLLFWGGER